MTELNRRRFLQVTAAGAVATSVLGTSALTPETVQAATTYTWISPRGTIEVLDDYPYWVAKEMGYFGDIDTRLEPGPSDGTATVKFVALGQADMGYPFTRSVFFCPRKRIGLGFGFQHGSP